MKKINGYDYYYASEDGKIFSNYKGKWRELKQRLNSNGYLEIDLGKTKRLKAHRIIANAYIPNLENKPQVNHKDGNKTNNHISNLEWVTNSENQLHAWSIGLQQKRLPSNAKMDFETADEIRREYRDSNISHSKLAEKYSVSKTTIGDILRGNIYIFNALEDAVIKEKKMKLNFDKSQKIRELWSTGEYSYNKLGQMFGVNHKTIKKVVENKIYKQ